MQRKRNFWVSVFLAITVLLSTFVKAVPVFLVITTMLLSTFVNAVSTDGTTPFADEDLVEFDHDIGYYAYYYNIDSARDDMYWRVYNSNITPEQKNIFVSYDDNVLSLVENYADCVDNMIRYYGVLTSSSKIMLAENIFRTFNIVVATASGNAVSTIATTFREAMDIARDAEDHIGRTANNMAWVYHYADLANDYYSSLPD